MKKLLFILLLCGSQSLQAQEKEIPENIKSIFAGIWEYRDKYQSNTIEITFKLGKEYTVLKDKGNGMAAAKTLICCIGQI